MPNFLFDVELSASIRVDAATEAEARAMMARALDCADSNFGAWPNGDPILGEVSLTPAKLVLVERDGESPLAFGQAFHIFEDEARGYRVVRLRDGAECTFHGDDQCERFRDNYMGDEWPFPSADAFHKEADEFGEWCEREGELPA